MQRPSSTLSYTLVFIKDFIKYSIQRGRKINLLFDAWAFVFLLVWYILENICNIKYAQEIPWETCEEGRECKLNTDQLIFDFIRLLPSDCSSLNRCTHTCKTALKPVEVIQICQRDDSSVVFDYDLFKFMKYIDIQTYMITRVRRKPQLGV